MRVNVSYSVELDEVLNEVQQLYKRESSKLQEVLLSAERSLEQEYSDKNLSEVVLAVEDYRRAIASFDMKLAEMANIIGGYASIKEQLKNPPQEQEVGEIEEN